MPVRTVTYRARTGGRTIRTGAYRTGAYPIRTRPVRTEGLSNSSRSSAAPAARGRPAPPDRGGAAMHYGADPGGRARGRAARRVGDRGAGGPQAARFADAGPPGLRPRRDRVPPGRARRSLRGVHECGPGELATLGSGEAHGWLARLFVRSWRLVCLESGRSSSAGQRARPGSRPLGSGERGRARDRAGTLAASLTGRGPARGASRRRRPRGGSRRAGCCAASLRRGGRGGPACRTWRSQRGAARSRRRVQP